MYSICCARDPQRSVVDDTEAPPHLAGIAPHHGLVLGLEQILQSNQKASRHIALSISRQPLIYGHSGDDVTVRINATKGTEDLQGYGSLAQRLNSDFC